MDARKQKLLAFKRGFMVINFVKTGEKAPSFYMVKIDKTGKITHGCLLYKTIVVEYEACVTMRQECILRMVLDSVLFITELKISDIAAVMSDKRLFNLSSFLRTHYGN